MLRSVWGLLLALVLLGVTFVLCLLPPGAIGVVFFLVVSLLMAVFWAPRLPEAGDKSSGTTAKTADTGQKGGASASPAPDEKTGGTMAKTADTGETAAASEGAAAGKRSEPSPDSTDSFDRKRILLLSILFADAVMLVQAGAHWLLTKLGELYPWSLQGLERPVAVVAALLVVLPIAAVALALSSVLILSLGITDLSQEPTDPDGNQDRLRLKAAGRALMLILGLGQGTAVLDKGKLWRGKTPIESFRGPGWLEVRPGYAVVVYVGGHEPELVSQRGWLNKDDTVTGIIDVHEQCVAITLNHVLSEDAFLDAVEFSIRYIVGRRQDESPVDRFFVSPVAAENYLLDSNPESYKRHIIALAEAAARSVIARMKLSEVIEEAGAANQKLAGDMKTELAKSAGHECHIEAILVGKIKLPDAVEREIVEQYTKRLKRQAARDADGAGKATSPV